MYVIKFIKKSLYVISFCKTKKPSLNKVFQTESHLYMNWALTGYNHLYIDPVWPILQFWIFVMIIFNAFDKVYIKPNISDILHTRLHEIFVIKQPYFYFVISFRLAFPKSLFFSDVSYNRTKLHCLIMLTTLTIKKIVKKAKT